MWHGIVWLVTGLLLALWSLGSWALHSVAQWGAGLPSAKATGAVTEAATQIGALRLPDWLAQWLPPAVQEQWGPMVSTFTPWVEYALTHAPSLVAWLVPAIWVLWALGGMLLLVMGGGMSAVILIIQRRRRSPAMS